MQDSPERSLSYAEGPDVDTLRNAYDTSINELGFYFQQTRQAYDDRRNLWPGKSLDLRKHGEDPFPWEGASDLEAQIVNEKINTYVSLLIGSLKRANIHAYPVGFEDAGMSKVVSAFLKWMRSNYIRDFYNQAERAANYWLEKGLMITYVGWEKTSRSFLEAVTLEQIAESSPEFAEMFADEANEPELAALLQQSFPSMKTGRARRVVKQLRTRGAAEVPFSRVEIDRPRVEACSPDGDVFYPSWCVDPQRSPYVFWRTFMTAQEIETQVSTAGWDRKWANYVIEHLKGVDSSELDTQYTARTATPIGRYSERGTDLIEIVYGYQRLIDAEDGSEGIYLTVFAPKGGQQTEGHPDYAKFELLSGLNEYPFVVTRLTEDQKRIYDLQTFGDLFRGTQMQVKTERDQRVDRASMATLPPIMHPPGRRPDDYGPGRFIPERREGEIRFGPVPQFDPGSMEVENTLIQQSDKVIGLDPEDPDSTAKKQFYVDKFLEHHSKVLKMAYEAHRRLGPERLVFRVTGHAGQQTMEKGMFDADLDLMLSYDVQNNDSDRVEAQLEQFTKLAMMDKFGKIDQEAMIEVLGAAINPVLADAVMKTKEQSTQGVLEDVTEDLTKIYSGIEVGARPGGAQIAMQAIEAYLQQPDVTARAGQDEAFAERLKKYYEQYQFQITQAENAEIGKLGNTPATFQGVQ